MNSQISDELENHMISEACRNVLMRYATAVDAHDIDAYVDVFADDAVWTRPNTDPIHGRDQVRGFIQSVWDAEKVKNPHLTLRRHCFTTVYIEPIDATTARGHAYALVYADTNYTGALPAPMGQPEVMAEYRTVFKKTPNGWKIAKHDASHAFRSDWAFVGLKDK